MPTKHAIKSSICESVNDPYFCDMTPPSTARGSSKSEPRIVFAVDKYDLLEETPLEVLLR